MAAQLILTKGLSLLGDFEWIALATSSLPVPLSPLISTVMSVGAIWSMMAFTLSILEFSEKSN